MGTFLNSESFSIAKGLPQKKWVSGMLLLGVLMTACDQKKRAAPS